MVIDGLLVGALVARYLGPAQLGQLAYAASLVSLVLPLVLFGLDQVAVRNFVQQPENRQQEFWAVFFSRFFFGVFFFLVFVTLLTTGVLKIENRSDFWILLYAFLGLLIHCLYSVKLLLEAEVLSKWTVWITNLWLLVASVAKLLLIWNEAPVESFALLQLAITVFTAVTLYIVVNRLSLLPKFTMPNGRMLSELLVECWPLALSGLAVALYVSLDISMLKWMVSSQEAGIYSVAASLSAFWYFVPVALQSTFMPILARQFSDCPEEFGDSYRKYLDLNIFCGFIAVAIGWLIVPFVIQSVFGPKYQASCTIFRLHIFSLFFVFVGVSAGTKMTILGLHKLNLLVRLLGASMNILFNILLIPFFGGVGAACATIVAYSFAGYVALWLFFKTNQLAAEITRSFIEAPFTGARLLIQKSGLT